VIKAFLFTAAVISSCLLLVVFFNERSPLSLTYMAEMSVFFFFLVISTNLIFGLPFLAVAKMKNWSSIKSFVVASLLFSSIISIFPTLVVLSHMRGAISFASTYLFWLIIISSLSSVDALLLRFFVVKSGYFRSH
jgi:hypothetical protein